MSTSIRFWINLVLPFLRMGFKIVLKSILKSFAGLQVYFNTMFFQRKRSGLIAPAHFQRAKPSSR